MTNKYSNNAPEMCWREATERGVGFLRVTEEFQREHRLEGPSITAF